MPAALVFVVAFAAYASTAQASIGWLDAPEITAAAACLGVPHSPGEPTVVLVGRAVQALVPVGDLALRMSLASALAGAAAAAIVCLVLAQLVGRAAPELAPRGRTAIAAGLALSLAFADAVWLQASRPEVYALAFLGLALALHLALTTPPGEAPPAGVFAGVGLAVGLAAATHHFIALTVAAPLGLWLVARRPPLRRVALGVAGALLGLAAFVYLPLRAARDPLVNWGDPDSLGRFLWTVSARAFQKSMAGGHADPLAVDAAQTAGALVVALGPALVLVALIGLYVSLRERRLRGVGALLLGVIMLGAGGRALLGFDWDNPDARGYLLPSALAITALAALGLATVAARVARPAASTLVAALALLAPLWGLTQNATARAAAREDAASDAWVAQLTADAPVRGVIVTSYFETAFQLWAATVVDGARPDALHVDRSFAGYPGMIELAAARAPELAQAVRAPLAVGHPTPLAALDALARPVAFELSGTLDRAALARLAPGGFWARLVAPGAAPDDAAMAAAERARPPIDGAAPAAVIWHEFARAQAACALGHRVAADAIFGRLAAALPTDSLLAEARKQCLAPPP